MKKLIAFVLFVSTVGTHLVFPAALYDYGETTGRAVNMSDVFRLEQYLAGFDVAIDLDAADVNNDGIVDREDVQLLRAYLAGHQVDISPAPLFLPPLITMYGAQEIHLELLVSATETSPGSDVDVQIYIAANSGVTLMDLRLSFDDERFELRSPTAVANSADFDLTVPGVTSPVPVTGMMQPFFSNNHSTGVLATVHFRVRDDALPGKSPFALSGAVHSVNDGLLVPVATVITNESVTVLGCDYDAIHFEINSVAKAYHSDEVCVLIYISYNPGVTMFNMGLEFDDSRLALAAPFLTVEYTDMMIPLQPTNPIALGGIVEPEFTNSNYTGLFVTVHFTVLDDAPLGNAEIRLIGTVYSFHNFSLIPVEARLTTGFIEIVYRCDKCDYCDECPCVCTDVLPGDVNRDGRVTSADATMLARWLDYQNVDICLLAADVNQDGSVTRDDLYALARALVVGGLPTMASAPVLYMDTDVTPTGELTASISTGTEIDGLRNHLYELIQTATVLLNDTIICEDEDGSTVPTYLYWVSQEKHYAFETLIADKLSVYTETGQLLPGQIFYVTVGIDTSFAGMILRLGIPPELEVIGIEVQNHANILYGLQLPENQDGEAPSPNLPFHDYIFAGWAGRSSPFTGSGDLLCHQLSYSLDLGAQPPFQGGCHSFATQNFDGGVILTYILRVREDAPAGITEAITIAFANAIYPHFELPTDINGDEIVISLPCGASGWYAIGEIGHVLIGSANQ